AAVFPHAHGRRVARAGPEARLRAEGPAERARAQPGDPDLRAGAARRKVHPVGRRRDVHVGVRLPAHRQHVPELAPGDRRLARHVVGFGRAQDHRDELRRAVRVPALIRFDEQVAIVTGAGHGLGRAYALDLAARGAAVVCNDLDAARAGAVAREIADAGGTAVADGHSVADAANGGAIVDATVDRFGRVDVVVNNAGQLRNGPFAELAVDDVAAVIATHLGGA